MLSTTTSPTTLQVISLLVSVIAPILVGLVTKVSTSSGVKAVLLALIAALVGIGTGFLDSPNTFDWWPAILTAFESFVVAVALHFGLWKPTQVSAKAQRALVHD